MNFGEFQQILTRVSAKRLEIWGDEKLVVEPHFHVTEVGLVAKTFVDCGGKRREDRACVLQTLVADDVEHRLTPQKLAGILKQTSALGIDAQLPVDLEIQGRTIEVWRVDSAAEADDVLILRVAPKQTACLAEDLCGLTLLPTVTTGCCNEGPTGCC
jgi:hypothetical protein